MIKKRKNKKRIIVTILRVLLAIIAIVLLMKFIIIPFIVWLWKTIIGIIGALLFIVMFLWAMDR